MAHHGRAAYVSRQLWHALIWTGFLLAALALAGPLVLTPTFVGIAPEDYVVKKGLRYYAVSPPHHGYENRRPISGRQYRLAKIMGEVCGAATVAGLAAATTGVALTLLQRRRHERYWRERRQAR